MICYKYNIHYMQEQYDYGNDGVYAAHLGNCHTLLAGEKYIGCVLSSRSVASYLVASIYVGNDERHCNRY